MIHVAKVAVRFGHKLALRDVSLDIREGATHVLLGLSGSGKSTLLRVLLNIIPPSTGFVSIAGEKPTPANARSWAHRIGYIPQDSGLFPHLSARENITLVASLLGWDLSRIEKRVDELMQLTTLDPSLLTRLPRELSGGQRQRVALMRAAFLDPPVMVLDEPLGALDPILRTELQEELKSAFSRLRKTVLLVTHDLAEAAFFARELTLLREGQIVQTGTLMDLLERPADPYVTRFVNAQRGLSFAGAGGVTL